MKNKELYVKIDDVLDLGEVKAVEKIFVEELDKMIAKDIAAVVNKYFPDSTLDEEKVLKLARMLIADEKGGK